MLSGAHRQSGPELVLYGRDAAEAVSETARTFGAKRLLLTTTRSLSQGPARRLADELGDLVVGVFERIEAHSPRDDVIAGAEAARAVGADLLVALGGGSAIDATKAMQLCLWAGLTQADELDDYRAGQTAAAKLAPGIRMIAVPTTLSAAEFTPFAGITDRHRRTKEGFTHRSLAPRAVILDPALTLATPPLLWFSTGMKAVDHAVEQLCHPLPAPHADALAAEGLRRLSRGLRASKAAPADLDARLDCQFGMWLAISGIGSGRGMGASHALGHTLGGSYGIPHGVTSCVTLPAVLAWNAAGDPGTDTGRQRVVAELLGAPGTAAEAVKALVRELRLPTDLAMIGITPDHFEAIAQHTMHDRGIASNPRTIRSPADLIEILRLAQG
jgi:maleylacetate reductase